MTVIDSGALIAPSAIKAAGHLGSFGYLSTSRPGTNFTGKPITKAWVDEMFRNGLAIISCWQYGKKETADWRRGYNGGRDDALFANRKHIELGGPENAPIFFAIDDDVDSSLWNNFCRPYLQGINSVLGIERTGVYGGINTINWAIGSGIVGRSSTDGKFYGWQTRSWSQGNISPGACVYQRIVDTQSNPGPIVGGNRVDVNDTLAADYGQWYYPRDDWEFSMTQLIGSR